MASAVPEGTAWAREGKAFARDVEARTHGEVRIKWYLGGIAGDELRVGERIRRDQLDGVGSGGILCMQNARTLRVMRAIGLFHDRAEVNYVLGRLKPVLDEEFKKSGFTNLWEVPLGPELLFTRQPIRSLEEMQQARLWIWNLDEIFVAGMRELGLHPVPMPLDEAARGYDDRRHDGWLTMPTAALAFQWSAQAKYITNLPIGFLTACTLISNRAFDSLPVEFQRGILEAGAKFGARMDDIGRQQDEALLGGLLEKQGLHAVPVSDGFREQLTEAARAARERQGVIPAALRAQVAEWLAAYRAEHAPR
jgi:TRAP-type C4-dicarboxylate transport system substrate-binding protein